MSENSGCPESSRERGIPITGDRPDGGHLPAMTDKIYDLLDVVDELPGKIYELTDIVEEPNPLPEEGSHEVMVIDGRGYKNAAQPEKINHDLDSIAEGELKELPQLLPDDEMMKKMVETVERIARVMIPDIAERLIREEIEKLKKESEEEVH